MGNQEDQSYQKRVLVAPLDWGLGHAARCIPIIRHLIQKNCTVTIAGEGLVHEMLKKEFPQASFIPLRGYRIRYPQKGNFFMPLMLVQVPRIMKAVLHEHAWLKKRAAAFDLIISDNRYGLYTKKSTSVLITHQVHIRSGWGTFPDWCLKKTIGLFIKKFDRCWIPDALNNGGIAGELSHPSTLPNNCRWIGPLSRMEDQPSAQTGKLVVMLSGPEPQRSVLEKKLITAIEDIQQEIVFVRGVDPSAAIPKAGNHIRFENHLGSAMLCNMIGEADLVICRSGYSSIMDLLKMRKKALLIPTPGQTEQMYLAERVDRLKWFAVEAQDSLDLGRGLKKAGQTILEDRPAFDFEGFRQALSDLGIQ